MGRAVKARVFVVGLYVASMATAIGLFFYLRSA